MRKVAWSPIRVNNTTICRPTQMLLLKFSAQRINSGEHFKRIVSSDHPVLIRTCANDLGYYENGGAGFVDSGFDMNSVPNYTTQFNFYNFHFANSSPFWEFSCNAEPIQAQITSSSASYQNGFYALVKVYN